MEPYNIPNTFHLQVGFADNTMNPVKFWSDTVAAMAELAHGPFEGKTRGYTGKGDISIVVIPEGSQRPPLRVKHIIWAIQVIAENAFEYNDYRWVRGTLRIDVNGARVVIGRIEFSDQTSRGPIPPLAMSEMNATKTLNARNPTGYEAHSHDIALTTDTISTQGLAADALQIDPYFTTRATKLPAPNIFLTLLKFLARIAEPDSALRIKEFKYRSYEITQCAVYYESKEDQRLTVTYGDVIEGVKRIAEMMMREKRFAEAAAQFFKRVKGEQVRYGYIHVFKFVLPPTEQGGGVTTF